MLGAREQCGSISERDHALDRGKIVGCWQERREERRPFLEVDGEIRGYLLGSRKPLQNQLYALYQNVWLFFRALTRYFRYNKRSRRFIRWVLMYGWHEVPAQPRRVPHFHMNLLPEARKVS